MDESIAFLAVFFLLLGVAGWCVERVSQTSSRGRRSGYRRVPRVHEQQD